MVAEALIMYHKFLSNLNKHWSTSVALYQASQIICPLHCCISPVENNCFKSLQLLLKFLFSALYWELQYCSKTTGAKVVMVGWIARWKKRENLEIDMLLGRKIYYLTICLYQSVDVVCEQFSCQYHQNE